MHGPLAPPRTKCSNCTQANVYCNTSCSKCSGVRSVSWIEPKVPDDTPPSALLAPKSGYLQLIDQRLLPAKLVLQKIHSVVDTAKAIKEMVR